LISQLKRGLLLIPFLILSLNASFIIQNDNILNQKSTDKLNEILTELKTKTDVSIYLIAKESLDGENITTYSKNIAKEFTDKSYVLLTFAKYDHKIDIISSDNLRDKFDEDDILNNYVIPLFISKDKVDAKYGAGIFNGLAELAEQVAKGYNITLKSAIGSDSKGVYDYTIYLIWFMIASFIGTIVYIFITRKG
jgi:uncharacterized membrane protein YgcG